MQVQAYLTAHRVNGAVICTAIVLARVDGIVISNDSNLLRPMVDKSSGLRYNNGSLEVGAGEACTRTSLIGKACIEVHSAKKILLGVVGQS